MKQFSLILFFFIAITTISTSCNGKKVREMPKVEKVDMSGKEYTSAFICPMHCEGSGSHEMGVCPVCGMDYEKNEKSTSSKNHEGQKGDDHEGHNHGEHDGHEGHNHN